MWPMRRIPAMESVYSANAVSRSPSDQAASPSSAWAAARLQLVVVRREGEHASSMVDRAGDVAAHQRQRGAVHLDRARQRPQLRLVDDDHARGVASRGRQRQPLLGVPQVFVDAIELAGRHQHADEPDGEHRPHAHDVLRDELRPRAERRVLPAAAHGRQRQLGELGGPVEVARRQRVPDRVGRLVVLREPRAGPAMQLGRGIRILVEEPRAQHVGEEVVIPIPLASIVERDHEQVLPIQRLERRLASGRARDRVAQRSLEAVEDRRLQHEPPHGFGLALQHFARQVVDDEAIVAGKAGNEVRDVFPSLHRQRRELQRGDPALGARFQRRDVVRRQLEAHRAVQVRRGLLGGEAQIGGSDLHQFAAHSQARQRHRRIGPARRARGARARAGGRGGRSARSECRA